MTFYRTQPLADVWENPTPAHERRSRYIFKATFGETLRLLERELRFLDPDRSWDQTNVVMHVACRPDDLRIDGGIRANARPFMHPGVRLTFNTPKLGDVRYQTDSYETWQHNVRAIALGLEALRAVDRYGITSRAEQYLGFKALPAGRAMPASHMTSSDALRILGNFSDPALVVHGTPDALEQAWREARRATHPDRNDGDHTRWNQVEEAARVLGLKR